MSEPSVPPVIQKPPMIPKTPGPVQTPAQPPPRPRKTPGGEVNFTEVLFRVGVFVLLVSSLALAWWSYFYVLGNRQKQVRDLTTQVSRLSAEVDELDRKWSPDDAGALTNKYAKLSSALFSGPASLESWWRELRESAQPLALNVKVDFGKVRPKATPFEKLSIIPTTVSLDVNPIPEVQAIETCYQRMLRFSQRLAYTEKRSDLSELSVLGGSNSVAHATMALELWAAEETPTP
jgi:hypothetical protein